MVGGGAAAWGGEPEPVLALPGETVLGSGGEGGLCGDGRLDVVREAAEDGGSLVGRGPGEGGGGGWGDGAARVVAGEDVEVGLVVAAELGKGEVGAEGAEEGPALGRRRPVLVLLAVRSAPVPAQRLHGDGAAEGEELEDAHEGDGEPERPAGRPLQVDELDGVERLFFEGLEVESVKVDLGINTLTQP